MPDIYCPCTAHIRITSRRPAAVAAAAAAAAAATTAVATTSAAAATKDPTCHLLQQLMMFPVSSTEIPASDMPSKQVLLAYAGIKMMFNPLCSKVVMKLIQVEDRVMLLLLHVVAINDIWSPS